MWTAAVVPSAGCTLESPGELKTWEAKKPQKNEQI